MSNTFRNLAVAIFALGSMTLPAQAVPASAGLGLLKGLPHGGHLSDGVVSVAPNAFGTFCETYPDQCSASGSRDTVALDAERWGELVAVNAHVNRTIRPQPDAPGTDVWTIGTSEGDCDDYAVEKRKELIDLGWPTAALSLSVAFIGSGEAHLLLTVRTDRGDFVLDNLRSRVVAADRIGYRWVARQSTIHPRLWVRIDGVAPDAVMVAEARTTTDAGSPKSRRHRVHLAAAQPSFEPAKTIVSTAKIAPVVADLGAASTLGTPGVTWSARSISLDLSATSLVPFANYAAAFDDRFDTASIPTKDAIGTDLSVE